MAAGFYNRSRSSNLPHRAIPEAICLVVEDAIRASWTLLLADPLLNLVTAHEDAITFALYKVLWEEVYDTNVVPGFDSRFFVVSPRESKVANYDETMPDKMPDLLVGLTNRSERIRLQDWIFIECKPIDKGHPVGSCYAKEGIMRFVKGEYAWAMSHAMMIGYTIATYPIGAKLSAALGKRGVTNFSVNSGPTTCPLSPHCHHSDSVEITVHDRAFVYRETQLQAPPIKLRHLWLRRN